MVVGLVASGTVNDCPWMLVLIEVIGVLAVVVLGFVVWQNLLETNCT